MQLVALLNDLAEGSFLFVKDDGEVTPAEAAVILVTRQYVDRLLQDGVL